MSDREHAPDRWAIADEGMAVTLGLPPRREGWGLLLFEAEGRQWTWAGDRGVVAALDDHEGDISGWDARFEHEADGWPRQRDDGRHEGMSWPAR